MQYEQHNYYYYYYLFLFKSDRVVIYMWIFTRYVYEATAVWRLGKFVLVVAA